jgi:hypothetical protein
MCGRGFVGPRDVEMGLKEGIKNCAPEQAGGRRRDLLDGDVDEGL